MNSLKPSLSILNSKNAYSPLAEVRAEGRLYFVLVLLYHLRQALGVDQARFLVLQLVVNFVEVLLLQDLTLVAGRHYEGAGFDRAGHGVRKLLERGFHRLRHWRLVNGFEEMSEIGFRERRDLFAGRGAWFDFFEHLSHQVLEVRVVSFDHEREKQVVQEGEPIRRRHIVKDFGIPLAQWRVTLLYPKGFAQRFAIQGPGFHEQLRQKGLSVGGDGQCAELAVLQGTVKLYDSLAREELKEYKV